MYHRKYRYFNNTCTLLKRSSESIFNGHVEGSRFQLFDTLALLDNTEIRVFILPRVPSKIIRLSLIFQLLSRLYLLYFRILFFISCRSLWDWSVNPIPFITVANRFRYFFYIESYFVSFVWTYYVNICLVH